MKKITLSLHPRAATQKILRSLPNKRLRDVIERRWGLRSGKPETLESIGASYRVTRERIRQIEEDGLKRLKAQQILRTIEPVFMDLARQLRDHGEVAEERKLFYSVADQKLHSHLAFLLMLSDIFQKKDEDEHYHPRWYTSGEAVKSAEAILARSIEELEGHKKPVTVQNLFGMLRNHAKAVLNGNPTPDMLDSYLGISKLIRQNPYGEFGLSSWTTINPRGVRDKAYAVLVKTGNPLHFRQVAGAIDKAGWDKKKAHPQTVHNELIKDNRFVLVGRGLYALREWGYEPGTVSDVISAILKDARRPLSREEMVKRVLEKRRVKESTVLLNIQNKKRFKRAGENYTLI